jgi:hypothetical protein
MKEFLPVGSVVLLKDAKKPLIIIGHSALEGNNKIWDYIGAIYPFGMMGEEKNLLFQRDQIEKVIFKGYEDEEGRKYLQLLEESMNKINE